MAPLSNNPPRPWLVAAPAAKQVETETTLKGSKTTKIRFRRGSATCPLNSPRARARVWELSGHSHRMFQVLLMPVSAAFQVSSFKFRGPSRGGQQLRRGTLRPIFIMPAIVAPPRRRVDLFW